jgi:hypothetical protein
MTPAESHLCRICGIRTADSDEHFIPKAIGNRAAVRLLVQNPDGGKRERRCTGGFFVRVLCQRCNNGPASTYAQAYANLYRQIVAAPDIRTDDGRFLVHCRRLHPLRIIKQAVLGFLCAVPWYPDAVWRPLQDCLLDREAPLPPSAPRVFLYFNTSQFGRIAPFCSLVELATHRSTVLSEVSWPPLGLIFAYDSHPIIDAMQELSAWGSESFSASRSVSIVLPRLRVNSLYPLAFGSTRAIERTQEERLTVFLHHVPPGSASPLNISALIRRN